jgi:hypothetical protein
LNGPLAADDLPQRAQSAQRTSSSSGRNFAQRKPYLERQLDEGAGTEFQKRFAEFLERVCVSGDVEAVNVIWLKIFKLLLARPKDLKLLWPLLGPATRANIEDAARRWRLIGNLPMSGMFGAIGSALRPH